MKVEHEVFSAFKNSFKTYVLEHYKSIATENEISGLGIFTDSDMSSFIIRINTSQHLLERNSKSETEGDRLINKWWMPEWGWESKYDDLEDDLVKQLEIISSNLAFDTFKRKLFSVYCEVLAELSEEKVLENGSEDLILIVQESDNFDSKRDKESLSLILNENQWDEYLEFNKHWMGY